MSVPTRATRSPVRRRSKSATGRRRRCRISRVPRREDHGGAGALQQVVLDAGEHRADRDHAPRRARRARRAAWTACTRVDDLLDEQRLRERERGADDAQRDDDDDRRPVLGQVGEQVAEAGPRALVALPRRRRPRRGAATVVVLIGSNDPRPVEAARARRCGQGSGQRRPYRLCTACRVTPSTRGDERPGHAADAGAAHGDRLGPVELPALLRDALQHLQRVAGLGGGDGHGVLLGHVSTIVDTRRTRSVNLG